MKSTALATICLTLLAGGCTTAEAIKRPGGGQDYVVACGAATGWNICYHRANELCPSGYKTADQEDGFNRKELTISCGEGASDAALQRVVAECKYEGAIATVNLPADRDAAEDRLFKACMEAKSASATPDGFTAQ